MVRFLQLRTLVKILVANNIFMFDTITVECELPNLRELFVGYELNFQTKDTPAQSLKHYKVDKDGNLWFKSVKREDVRPWTNPENDSTVFRKMYNFVTVSEEWLPEDFNGPITFYDSYEHAEYNHDDWRRYVTGWLEYRAVFENGKMISIVKVVDTAPVKLTDAEIKAKKEERSKELTKFKLKITKEKL